MVLGLGWRRAEFVVLPIMLFLIFIIAYFSKKMSNYRRKKIFEYTTILIVFLELIKQIINIIDGFDMWPLPLHYCSMFVFFFPLAQFGNKKFSEIFKPLSFVCSLAMSICFYLSPSSIIGNSSENVFKSFYSFHTFFFHHLVIFYCILSITLNDYVPQKKDYRKIFVVMFVYSVIALSMSYILNTNYCNFLSSTVEFIETIRQFVGQVVYTIFVFFAVCVGTTLISYIYYIIYNKHNRVKE